MKSCFPFTILIISLLSIRAFFKFVTKWDRSPTCLVGKTTLVTGSNSGIGFHTAMDFAKRGGRVILACRNKDCADFARLRIISESGNSDVVVKSVDLSSLSSVREFAQDINQTEERLDILVNNAGIAGVGNITTGDGLNMVMQVNHLGPFLLTNLLIDLLKKSAPSKIINVTCNSAHLAQLNPNNINRYPVEMSLPKTINYANSKLCNILFTNELARRLKGTHVYVNSLNPGISDTKIYKTVDAVIKFFLNCLQFTIFKTPEEGAQTSIYVATSKDVEGISGQYFDNCGVAWLPPMPTIALNEHLAKKVWKQSEELVKLNGKERESYCRCKNTQFQLDTEPDFQALWMTYSANN